MIDVKKYIVIDIEVDGIDTNDYPDFCDAYICSASLEHIDTKNIIEARSDVLDALNEDYNLVYEHVIRKVF